MHKKICTVYDLLGHELLSCEDTSMWNSYFESHGAIEKDGEYYYYSEGKFICEKYKIPYRSIILKDGGYYFYINGELRPLPNKIDYFNGTGDCLIYEENNQWMILEWDTSLQKYCQFNVFSDIDHRSFTNVMFCEDHNQLLCQLKDGTFCYYNIETEQFDKFEMETSVARNFNASQLLVTGFKGKENDAYRRVVFKDPMSLKEITPECLSQYGIFSIDGRYGITYGSYDRLFKSENIKDEKGKCHTKIYIYVHDKLDEDFKVDVPERLSYVNYITFSYDTKYMAVVGATTSSGYILIYNLKEKNKVIEYPKMEDDEQNSFDKDFLSSAIWIGAFNKDNTFILYNSNPITYILEEANAFCTPKAVRNRNFLCFSPSGRYFASSNQGYNAFGSGFSNWGHQKSTKVFIKKMDELNKEMGPYEDIGCGAITASSKHNVGSVAFSLDESKLLIVADDGTFVVRNINLEDESNWKIKEEH